MNKQVLRLLYQSLKLIKKEKEKSFYIGKGRSIFTAELAAVLMAS